MTPQTDMEQFWDPWMRARFPGTAGCSFPLGIFQQARNLDAPSLLPMEATLFFFSCLPPFPKEQPDPGLFLNAFCRVITAKSRLRSLGQNLVPE